MKQGLRQLTKQSFALTPRLQNQIKLLALPGEGIRIKIKELINEFCEEEESKEFFLFRDILLVDRYKSLLKPINTEVTREYQIIEKNDLKNTLLDQ